MLKHIRTIVYVITGVFYACVILGLFAELLPRSSSFAFLAIIYLFLTLSISPAYDLVPHLPLKVIALKARKALSVSTFFFAISHVFLQRSSIFVLLRGDGQFTGNVVLALLSGTVAILVITLMAATSFNSMVRMLGQNWKKIHRLIYPAGFLIFYHVGTMSTTFSIYPLAAYMFFVMANFLVYIEFIRLNTFLNKRKGTNYLWWPIPSVLFAVASYVLLLAK